MTGAQTTLDLVGRPSARVILDRIRSESRDESEKGRWPDWPEGEALTGLVVKRVEVMPQTDPPKLRLISANPAYDPYDCLAGEAHIAGTVIWVLGRV